MEKKKRVKLKRKKVPKIKILVLFFLAILSFIYTVKALDKVNLKVDELFLKTLSSSGSNITEGGISSNIIKYVVDLDFLNPVSLINGNYKRLVDIKKEPNIAKVDAPVKEPEKKEPAEKKEPIIYIYNTHQTEEYASNNLFAYNIKPTVLLGSYILQDKLDRLGIKSVVENQNVSEILTINSWNYASSYKVTKMFLEQSIKDYSSLKYFIDVHRDSVAKDITTATINGEEYAKVMFLLGLDNPNYKRNEIVINKMNNIIKNKYPGISRGVYEKKGKGMNGVYNQDFSPNCILIEVGGVDNTIEEVSNTIAAIADMINTYIGDENG